MKLSFYDKELITDALYEFIPILIQKLKHNSSIRMETIDETELSTKKIERAIFLLKNFSKEL